MQLKILSKLINWYFSKSALPYWCVLMMDSIIVMFAGYVGFYFKLGGGVLVSHFWPITAILALCVLICVPYFKIFHTYSGILRFSSYRDLLNIAIADFCAIATFYLIFLPVGHSGLLDPAVIPNLEVCTFMMCISTMLMIIARILMKTLFQMFRAEDAMHAVIYGTKAGGISIANSISAQKEKKYILKGFISDGAEMKKAYLLGKPVYLNHPGLAASLAAKGVKVLLVSPLKTDLFRNNSTMVDEFIGAGIKVMLYASEVEWDGKSSIQGQLQEMDIEDLLPRDKIEIDMAAIAAQLKDKSILVTGAAGSIGSEIVHQVAQFHPKSMILVDQAETPMHDIRMMMAREFSYISCETIVVSICNEAFMEQIFSKHKPDYVFHAAAYKHVPMMEDNPVMAVENNIYGTRVIADLAVKYGTRKFVMISTDKAVNPTNVMGCSKRICEIYCQSLNQAIVDGRIKGHTQFVTTRFGNVLGSNGSVIPIFKEQIRKGGPLTVTHPDIIRYFMLIPEACRLVLEAGTMGKGGEIFVFDMGKPVRIVDLAKRMIALSGAGNIKIEFTGLREGEKLYEEVLSDKESTRPTPHPKIMVAAVREYDYNEALEGEKRLMEAATRLDAREVVRLMKEIVPEYISQKSRWSDLDAKA